MDHYKLFIDGEFVEAQSGERFETIDPGTGLPFATVAKAGKADAEAAIAAAKRAFDDGRWSGLTPQARANIVYNFADQVAQQTIRLAMTESMDAGHCMSFAKFWGMLCSGQLRNWAHFASRKFQWEEEIPYSGNVFAPGREFIRREPIGVCVGIVPWNFPLSMAIWKVGQAIIMGNTIVLKPATSTPLSALILAEAAKAAGMPPGVINVLPGPGGELGRILCTHPDVDKIAITGSTEVGREIMKMASDTVKKVTLELGGKSASIILDDADMDMAVMGACHGTFFHQGQVCDSGTRILVQSKIYDEFMEKFIKQAESFRIGYQMLPDTHLGPIANATQLATIENYVRIGQEEGAKMVTGGKRVEVPGFEGGYYYAPTIFTEVKNSMRIAQEEIFGPVVCVMKFDTEEEAVAIANDSIYGLGGGVFSTSNARAERVARQIRTGTVWINNYHISADFCPFGGYKQSGVGRELGAAGLAEYTQIKRIHVSSFGDPKSNFTISSVLTDETKVAFVQYNGPTNVLCGNRTLPSIYKEAVNLGCKRMLILTDPGVRQTGLVDQVQDALVDFCVGVFDEIAQDTDLEIVDKAAAFARERGADGIVSVGGGSVIDTAKVVGVVMKNGGEANEHIAIHRLQEPQTPHIVIPTTSGTGSEVTNVAVIKSKTAGRKVFLVDNRIIPNTAILDPQFTASLPHFMTVASAMDAMTHAMEALTSILAQPICDGQALQAIRLIHQNLPLVVANPRDLVARNNLQIAATMAGWAFMVTQTGLVHAMSHTVGILHNVPHGAGCGIILPAVMRYNIDYAADKLAMAAQAMGVNIAAKSTRDAGFEAAAAVEKLMKDTGHPLKLQEVGVKDMDIDTAAFHAVCDSSSLFNARPVNDPAEVAALYREVY